MYPAASMLERVREMLGRLRYGRTLGRCAECGRAVHEYDDYTRVGRAIYHSEHVRYVPRK